MPIASSTLFDSVASTSDLEFGIHPLSPVSVSVTKTPSPKQADSSMAAALQEASPTSNYLACHSPILNLSPNMSPESQAASASPVFDLLETARTRNVHELYGSLSSITQDLVNFKQEDDVKNEPPKKRRRVIQADGASSSAVSRHASRPRSHRRRSGASNHAGSSANHRTDMNANINRNPANPSGVQQSTIQDFLPAQILSERLTNQQPVEGSRANQILADSQLTNHHPAHLHHHMVRSRVHPERCVHPGIRPSHLTDAGMTLAPQPAHLPFYPVMSFTSQGGYLERDGHAITRHSNRSHSQQVPTDLSSRRAEPHVNQPNTQNTASFYRHPHIHTAAPPQQYISAVPLDHRAAIGRVPTSHMSSVRNRGTQPHMGSSIPVNSLHAHPYSRISHMSQFAGRHSNAMHRPYFAAPGVMPGAAHTHLAGVGPSGQPYPTSFLLQLWAMFNPGTAGPYRMEIPDEMGEIENYEALLNLAERLSEAKPKGLNKPEIEKLCHYVFNPNLKRDSTKDQSTCVVCMCDFETGEKLRVLPCSHEFHMKCVDKWLKSNRTCPICRSDASKPAN